MKNIFERMSSRVDEADDQISDLEDMEVENSPVIFLLYYKHLYL